MPDYNDFLKYAFEHENEVTYDIVSHLRNAHNDGITLSQDDICLITKIAIQSNYSVLRQYHEWMTSQL